MIRRGLLDSEPRQDLIELERDGAAAHRLARRANALVLRDNGMSCEPIAAVLLLDDDMIRSWYQLYQGAGIEGLASFNHEGGSCRLTAEQQDRLKAWIGATQPGTTRQDTLTGLGMSSRPAGRCREILHISKYELVDSWYPIDIPRLLSAAQILPPVNVRC